MTKILTVAYIVSNLILGSIISYLFLKRRITHKIKKYKEDFKIYEKKLTIITQDLKNESNIRNNTEKKLHDALQKNYELHGQISAIEERLKELNNYRQKYENENNKLNNQLKINLEQKIALKELFLQLEKQKNILTEKEKLFINNEKRLSAQFENLTNRIFDQTKNKINEQNRETLDHILNPLREQLNIFTNQIQNNFSKEEHIRQNLIYEINNLNQLSVKITQETINLTQALKGNNKTQGNWGEMILTKALEASGMREGHEFHLQVNINNNKEQNGNKLQPDVIVHLPNGKNVIIDAKISLLAYERYFNSNNEKEKNSAITDHVQSLRTHIKSLNKKNYQELLNNTLDYILMFVPIESAFIIAIEKETSLLTDAMNRNIMLVSPTTLLIALRTINNLWNYEYQNFYAKKIAEKASKLYDKLRLFMEDLNKIGLCLNKAESIYNTAKNKFSEGKGNIISQVESFRQLGVQVKQPIISNNSAKPKTIFLEKNQNHNQSTNTE